jgi:glyoxylase-like metal-dependent hydrolase (beta-lactamase superfamily II)
MRESRKLFQPDADMCTQITEMVAKKVKPGENLMRIVVFLAALVWSLPGSALEMVSVTDGVYAIVGELSQRSPKNFGNNATFGVVVTDEGVVLIDPGASAKGAAEIEAQISKITDKPVKIVVNTGGQDHRWLGNDYFKQKGAHIIASSEAVTDQKERTNEQFQGLEFLIGKDNLDGTEPVHADQVFDDKLAFDLGGIRFEAHYAGGGHTPGDAFVWMPGKRVMFTGDIAYFERTLAVLPVSNSGDWVASFKTMAAFNPEIVVPGHGHPGDLDQAKTQTLHYLENLRTKVRDVLDRGGLIAEGTAIDQSAYSGLVNFEGLAKRNAQAVYIEMEFD